MLIFNHTACDRARTQEFKMPGVLGCFLRIVMLLAVLPTAQAAEPQVWGYGVQGCAPYMETFIGQANKDPRAVSEFRLYREWLAGVISGMSAATAMDVLQGLELEEALKRLHALCQQQASEDVFTMAMTLVRERNTPNAAPASRPAAPAPRTEGYARPSPEARADCGPAGSIATAGGCR